MQFFFLSLDDQMMLELSFELSFSCYYLCYNKWLILLIIKDEAKFISFIKKKFLGAPLQHSIDRNIVSSIATGGTRGLAGAMPQAQ
jgi:hypothetical protein